MSDINCNQNLINLEQPFATQPEIQAFLDSEFNQVVDNVSDDILSPFLSIVENFIQGPDLTEFAGGIKIGYERAIDWQNQNNQYRIISHFISNQCWQSENDLKILNPSCQNITFLSDDLSDPDRENDENTSRNESENLIWILCRRVADELLRRYPRLQDCKEFHFYVFLTQPKSSSSHEFFSGNDSFSRDIFNKSTVLTAQTCNRNCTGKSRYQPEVNSKCISCP